MAFDPVRHLTVPPFGLDQSLEERVDLRPYFGLWIYLRPEAFHALCGLPQEVAKTVFVEHPCRYQAVPHIPVF